MATEQPKLDFESTRASGSCISAASQTILFCPNSAAVTPPRIPPIQGLLAFEAVARLRSVTLASEELSVTPSAISHRIRQLETHLALKLFARHDFSLSVDGVAYLVRVREALAALQQVPGPSHDSGRVRLRVAVTPTFSRQLLLPRLALFRHAYPEIALSLQVTIPLLNMTAEESDIELRFGTGPFPDRESMHLLSDEVSPVCSPDYLHEAGPFDGFDNAEAVSRARLIRTPLEPWRTWFMACGVAQAEPRDGDQFNDLGLVLDAAVTGFGVALMRLKIRQAWRDRERLVRLSPRSVRSPHDYFLCWKPGTLERWECATFIDWLRQALRD